MTYRLLPVFVLVMLVLLLVGAPVQAQKDSHEGAFVKATSDKEFVMEDKGKEHSHTLAADAKVIGPDGKECKLKDLKKGQKIKVTTKEGDMKIATRVEAVKA